MAKSSWDTPEYRAHEAKVLDELEKQITWPLGSQGVCEGVSNDHPFVDFSRFIDGTYHPEYRDTPATEWEQLNGRDAKRFGKFLPR